VVIAAGDPAKMKEFLKSNPGFISRISDEFNFDE
jgi:hypothetical protein